MIIFERLGGWGLGNSLFQIATTISIARHNNTNFGFPDDCSFKQTRFNLSRGIYFNKDLPWINFTKFKSKCDFWGFGDIGFRQLPTAKQDMIIDGFFQSEKYFVDHRSEVLETFELKPQHNEYISNKFKHLIEDVESCCLHVRRGDYATAQELIILSLDYYKKATEYFGNKTHFIIFSDDLQWCKENFNFLPHKTFIEEKNDLIEMHLMKRFKKHIIANSTFSWWGAWMAENNVVIMPNPNNNWFSESYYRTHSSHCTFEDLVCKNWMTI